MVRGVFLLLFFLSLSDAFTHLGLPSSTVAPVIGKSLALKDRQQNDGDFSVFVDRNRRRLWLKGATRAASFGLLAAGLFTWTRPVWAASRSRFEGYSVQKSEDMWKSELSDMQYFVLRQGGTERPRYSVLEKEYRPGMYKCAGCGTVLFLSSDKFSSGTGWPSFARGLPGVEVDRVDPITRNLAGAELRCKQCGGHLGDVFRDGFLFPGTEAFETGERYCIDGAALVFYPDEVSSNPIRGDLQAKAKEPDWMSPPSIPARDRSDA